MPAPSVTDVELLQDGRPVGLLSLQGGRLLVAVRDEGLSRQVADLAAQSLPWLADEEGMEATVRRVAEPGTEEHLRVLMFEVRRLGLEARLHRSREA